MLVTTQCHASRWSMQFLWLHTLTLLSHSNHELAGESLLCMSGLACCCAWHLPEVNIGIVHCAVCITLCLPCHVAVRLFITACYKHIQLESFLLLVFFTLTLQLGSIHIQCMSGGPSKQASKKTYTHMCNVDTKSMQA